MRRHVAREHRDVGGRIPTKFGSTRVLPDPIPSLVAAAFAKGASNIPKNLDANADFGKIATSPPLPPSASSKPQ